MGQAVHEKQKHQQCREDAVVQHGGVFEVEQIVERAALVNHQAVIGAVFVHADKDEVQHLRERQGDQNKIQPFGAQTNRAGDEREGGAANHRQAEVQEAVVDFVVGGDADAVRADADVGGVAEADHAAADDQAEAEHGDGEYQYAGQQVQVEALPAEQNNHRRGEQRDHQQCATTNSTGDEYGCAGGGAFIFC